MKTSTRTRAIVASIFTAAILFLGITEIFDYESILRSIGFGEISTINLIFSFTIAALIALLTSWVLYFKVGNSSFVAVFLFPSFISIPLTLAVESTIEAAFPGLGQVAIGSVSAILYGVILYLLFLTSNILNGAVLYNIPLGQAGKAAQFIFSLVSLYILVVSLFNLQVLPLIFLGIFIPILFYLTYSNLWVHYTTERKKLVMSTLVITIVTAIHGVIVLMWPVNQFFSALTIIAVYYIGLNIALEIRKRIDQVVWIEYILLLSLVILLLFANSTWGINGSLL